MMYPHAVLSTPIVYSPINTLIQEVTSETTNNFKNAQKPLPLHINNYDEVRIGEVRISFKILYNNQQLSNLAFSYRMIL